VFVVEVCSRTCEGITGLMSAEQEMVVGTEYKEEK
jgi:hypothetical protein